MMSKYRISLLKQRPGTQVSFNCDAPSLEDAIAQAKAAYPDWQLSGVSRIDLSERYWIVTGRIPGDDEDMAITTIAQTREEAIATFEDDIWDATVWYGDETVEERRERLRKEHGTSVFINAVAVSSAPIEITP